MLKDKTPVRFWINGKFKFFNALEHESLELEPVTRKSNTIDNDSNVIYEGDIVEYYNLEPFRQQSFDTHPPEIEAMVLQKNTEIVIFDYKQMEMVTYESGNLLKNLGLNNLGKVADLILGKHEFKADSCDFNGTSIDKSILGIKIVGNVFENVDITNSYFDEMLKLYRHNKLFVDKLSSKNPIDLIKFLRDNMKCRDTVVELN